MGLISNGTTIFDNGSMGSGFGGNLNFISSATASSSASIEFTSGIDSTYKEYVFYFNSIHPQNDGVYFQFQSDTGTNTNYNQTITSTFFRARLEEADANANLGYRTGDDLAQSTSFQRLTAPVGNQNDECCSGYLQIYNPSSSVFVKHFIARLNTYQNTDATNDQHVAGYFNQTTPLTRFQFKMSSGNIDAGQILLFGVN